MAQSPDLIKISEDIKKCILARFDPTKTEFLKTNRSALGMDWILMQPEDDEEPKKPEKKIVETDEFDFNLKKME